MIRRYSIAKSILPTAILLLSLAGCLRKEADPAEAPKIALEQVMDSLYICHNYDLYINAIYTEGKDRLLPLSVTYNMLRQHVESMEVKQGFVTDCTAHTVVFHTDTLATIHYTLMFDNGKSEEYSQKMARVNHRWQLVVRN